MPIDQREKKYEQLKKLLATFSDHIEGTVYHYTSSEALRGIIDNNEIWLTNTSFVNDKTECKVLKDQTSLSKGKDFTNDFVQKYWERFKNPILNDNTYYIASFSKVGNSLEQWRAYGNFCIGFDAKKLAESGITLYECVYRENDIKKWILEKEKGTEWQGDCLDDQSKRLAASDLIFSASIKLKSNYFKNEEEVRLFAISNYRWDFPNSPSLYEKDLPIHFRDHVAFKLPIPYIKYYISELEKDCISQRTISKQEMKQRKLKFEKHCVRSCLPINEIWIGPMPRQEEEEVACRILLSENGYENVNVQSSEIPYRGF